MYNIKLQSPRIREDLSSRPKTLLITAIVTLTIGGVVSRVGLFTPYLIRVEYSSITYHTGIYTVCGFAVNNVVSCDTLLDAGEEINPDWLKVCQAVGFVGSTSSLVGWFMMLYLMCQHPKTQCFKYSIILIVIFSVICHAAVLAVFISKCDDVWVNFAPDEAWVEFEPSWGYYTSWFGVALMGIAAIILWFYPAGPLYSLQNTAIPANIIFLLPISLLFQDNNSKNQNQN